MVSVSVTNSPPWRNEMNSMFLPLFLPFSLQLSISSTCSLVHKYLFSIFPVYIYRIELFWIRNHKALHGLFHLSQAFLHVLSWVPLAQSSYYEDEERCCINHQASHQPALKYSVFYKEIIPLYQSNVWWINDYIFYPLLFKFLICYLKNCFSFYL